MRESGSDQADILWVLLFVGLTACSSVTDHRPPGSDAAPPTAEPNDGPWCTDHGFCWVVPRPQGNGLRDVDGLGPTEVVAVGDYGTSLRFDGGAWLPLLTGTTDALGHVWVAPDGAAWMAPSSSHDSGVYLLRTHNGEVERFGLPDADLIVGLDGSGDQPLVAERYAVYRLEAGGFRTIFTPPADHTVVDALVAGTSTWVLTATPLIPDGPDPTTVLFRLSQEDVVERIADPASTRHLARLGDGTIVVFDRRLYRVEDGSLEEMSSLERISAVWGTSWDDLWVVTNDGTYHNETRVGVESRAHGHLWGTADGSFGVRVGMRGAISTWSGETWRDLDEPTELSSTLDPNSFGELPTELWAGEASAAWASSPNDVWRVTGAWDEAMLEHWDGQAWTREREVPQGGRMRGTGPDNVWLLPRAGFILQFDGTAWVRHAQDALPGNAWAVRDFCTQGPADTHLVGSDGENGMLWHWDGLEWSLELTVEDSELRSIYPGRRTGELFVLSQHPDGAELLRLQDYEIVEASELPGTGFYLRSLIVDDAGVRLLRGGQLLERRNGSSWTLSDVGFDHRFARIWEGPSGTWVHDGDVATVRR